MRIHLSHYRIAVPIIKSMIERNPDRTPESMISEITIATSVPIIAVAHFVGELCGFSEELNRQIQVFNDFYNYEEILE